LAPGGLVDGPIATRIYNSLRGLRLNQPDEFAEFQTAEVVYHDDVGDYSTNEPTMDGTADAILMMALWDRSKAVRRATPVKISLLRHEGAIIRADRNIKKLALVFTGDEFAEGATAIADALKDRDVRASFFLTGRFYRNPAFRSVIQRLKTEGHYLGPHSNDHLLYCDWNERDKLLVTRQQFANDLRKNYAAMRGFGITFVDAPYFLPPFEWYNQKIADWTRQMNLTLINFTPGTRSHADYTTPEMKNYIDSKDILESIKAYESTDPAGLNGFILLSHIGVGPQRVDKFYDHLGEMIDWLQSKGYRPVRIDELLQSADVFQH
jgi:peptidoglycan/xylan/chitin deacetylase (PgdA/CDA1 family)